MEGFAKAAWISLALVHVMPAAVLFAPSLTQRMYDIAPDGDVGILIVHRGALFLAIIVTALFAAFDPAVRRAAPLIVAISVIGFLLVYIRADMPPGALRTIAVADLVALLPLVFVFWNAWIAQPKAA